jgi:fucose 4-O-acetylase-like acetyltransferase
MPGSSNPLTEPRARQASFRPASTSSSGRQAARASGRRDESLDIAKGFGIVLVVLGHSLLGLNSSGFFPPNVAWPTVVLYVIYLFHMPLFFVISGHLASARHRPAKATFLKLLTTMVYPYILWSVLEGLTLIHFSGTANTHADMSMIDRIYYYPIVPYWFLYALFVCHISYLAIRNLSLRVQISVAVLVFLIGAALGATVPFPIPLIVSQTVNGFLYFVLGVVTVPQVKQFGRWMALAATIFFAAFAIIFYQSQWTGLVAPFAVIPACISGIIATLAWSRLFALQQGPTVSAAASVFAFLGRYSMSIYVMHIFITAGTRIALKRLGANPTVGFTILEIAAGTILGVALPLAVNWLASKLSIDRWLGIQRMETV